MEFDCQFDIAFSFLAKDEGVALAISNSFAGSLSAFIYSEKQTDLIGTDGEERLNRVFGKQARMVVVLYRDGWGKTPWTRIEETAIRNRMYEEGYEFAIFLLLESNASIPQWVPKNKIWGNYSKYGPSGVAASIENRFAELGGMSRLESPSERAARIAKTLQMKRSREEFLKSAPAVECANGEFDRFVSKIKALADQVSNRATDFSIRVEDKFPEFNFRLGKRHLSVYWGQAYINTLDDSELCIDLLEVQGYRRSLPGPEVRSLKKLRLVFTTNDSDEYGWRDKGDEASFFASDGLAEISINMLLDQYERPNE
ncbi:MAG: hypothetical protein WAU88_15675 [Candidatus Zixiibacteriota bacterium]